MDPIILEDKEYFTKLFLPSFLDLNFHCLNNCCVVEHMLL